MNNPGAELRGIDSIFRCMFIVIYRSVLITIVDYFQYQVIFDCFLGLRQFTAGAKLRGIKPSKF
jgi:hypothetical protein